MDSNSIWQWLSSISVGTIIAWVSVILAIIGAVSAGTIRLYKVFQKYTELRNENDEQKQLIRKHEQLLNDVVDSLNRITESLDEQKEVNLKQIRCSIVHICDEALDYGSISAGKLRSVEELYDEYVKVFHGNGYITTMVKKVELLPVIGKLDM